MSNLIDIAKRIPTKVRRERLLVPSDPIGTAEAVSINPAMKLLFNIWYEFVEPANNGNLNCPSCLANVLQNFRAIKPVLFELEAEQKMLDNL